jgi:glycine/D-amino acid oxidase-like deaminating enzyme
MIKIFPELAQARIEYRWSGRIGISANLNPQIGRLAPNVYYAQAYSGHGVASAHLSGRMIADAITGQSDDFDMFASIRHQRVPNIDLIHKLARVWGMNSRRFIEWF